MMLVMALLIAGIGLFFFGLQLLTENLQALAGRRLRDRIAKWTRNPVMGLAWGGVLVAVTQSMAVMTFVLISMLRSGMITVFQSLPILIGGNIAAGIIVMILVFNIKMGVLFLLGFAALLFTSRRRQPLHSLAGAALGIGLLYFGLETMHDGVKPLEDAAWFAGLLESTRDLYPAGLLVGAALSFLVQSSVAVVVLAVAFYEGDVLSLGQAIMVVYGANVGVSMLTLVLSIKLSGEARQIAMYQTAYNFIGAAILVPLFYVELYLDVPLIQSLVSLVPGPGGERIAVTFILFNTVPGLLLFIMLRPSARLLARLWPETAVEQASKPKFLQDLAVDDPESTIDLVDLEQARLIGFLSDAFNIVRENRPRTALAAQQAGFRSLSGVIREALAELASRQRLSDSGYDRLNALMSRQHALEMAGDLVASLADHFMNLKRTPAGERFSVVSLEGLDAIVLTLAELARTKSAEDRAELLVMTADDGSIAKVREGYLAREDDFDAAGRAQLLATANLAERLIWLLGRIGETYSASAD